ncbi:hypothetical protein chiPu_0009721 [Chiloscyllium punctatum]|uniref:DUF4708 domain-containing protein n=1 Tax=Chiloscyllium punctatum TaxID=137246 RepID=A0A401SLJ6_CHIPU|nr:hypothetical protein [Chiloscyllium punctatum]
MRTAVGALACCCREVVDRFLPDLRKLCGITVKLNCDDADARSLQILTCRELLFLYPEVLAAPGEYKEILTIMSIPFYKMGNIQAYVQKQGGTMDIPQRVIPTDLQMCLSYSLIAKLAPNWNKVGHLLIHGKDFLNKAEKQNAVVLELNVSETQLCISVEASTIRLSLAKYGYNLPEITDDITLYYTVYFKLIGEKLFTTEPVQFFPRVDLEPVLTSFFSDLKVNFSSLCGLPIKMTNKPYYATNELNISQVLHMFDVKEPPKQEKQVPTQSLNLKTLTQKTFCDKKAAEKRQCKEKGTDPTPKKPKSKPVIQDVDVAAHAKHNQLSKLNSVTLQSWLKSHGVSVKTRDKKEHLVSKIMEFIKGPTE